MTEARLRLQLITAAKKFIGYSEADGSHRKIIDIYNEQDPLPVGYKVKYTDAWCAAFASVAAIEAGLTAIVPCECSCARQIEAWKKLGRWHEDENYKPSLGDYIYYDWQDGADYAKTDNIGTADHVGIVETVTGEKLRIIEGNYQNAVAYRTIYVNSRYIRGYGLPDFAGLAREESVPWYADSMAWAKEQKIITEERPTDKATRAEVVQMLYAFDKRLQEREISGEK